MAPAQGCPPRACPPLPEVRRLPCLLASSPGPWLRCVPGLWGHQPWGTCERQLSPATSLLPSAAPQVASPPPRAIPSNLQPPGRGTGERGTQMLGPAPWAQAGGQGSQAGPKAPTPQGHPPQAAQERGGRSFTGTGVLRPGKGHTAHSCPCSIPATLPAALWGAVPGDALDLGCCQVLFELDPPRQDPSKQHLASIRLPRHPRA